MVGGFWFMKVWAKSQTLSQHNQRIKGQKCVQMVEFLPNRKEALSLNDSTTKKKKVGSY
jgi:hypothetical protein